MPPEDREKSTLEEVRERLYKRDAAQTPPQTSRTPLSPQDPHSLPHAWGEKPVPKIAAPLGPRHVKAVSYFFFGAFAFFLLSFGIAGYFIYYGGNSVSVKNIDLKLQGPSTIAGGDTVPISIMVINRNTVPIENATLEVDFPEGTRSATDVLTALPVYNENLGTIKSGESVTASVKAVVFGAAGQSLSLPVTLTYSTSGSNATFVKKATYDLAISSTPLSVSVDSLSETTAGKPFTIALQIRQNATTPIENAVLGAVFPQGFALTSASVQSIGSSFLLGTLKPGETKSITLVGTLDGQDGDERVFHFTVGTARSPGDALIAVEYMTQDATVKIAAPFIETALTLNGSPLSAATLAPGQQQNVTVTYTNTLSTTISDPTISVSVSGGAVDYSTIESAGGFYNSADHTVIFSRDTDPSLATLAPGATGVGSFSFSTASAGQFGRSPGVTFTISVAGTRLGQGNVPEEISASQTQSVKAATAVVLTAQTRHATGPLTNSGPMPPQANQTTSYTVTWHIQNTGSAVADGVVTATLPVYVTYTGANAGTGTFSYNENSRTVTWNVGNIGQNGSADGSFQVALVPSTSQQGTSPSLTSAAAFSGYDRFAGVSVSASADPVTTETTGDSGYKPGSGAVH